jgi:uncharacterized protein (TIGR03083 family)
MDVHQLLARLDKAWADLRDAYSGLDDASMLTPGVIEGWSVKDVLAHVTTWEEEALKYLPLIIAGGRPPRYATYGGIDAFNAETSARKQSWSLPEVLRQLEETHERLVVLVAALPPEQIERETRARRRLRLDTYSHYPEHANAIREWRRRRTK